MACLEVAAVAVVTIVAGSSCSHSSERINCTLCVEKHMSDRKHPTCLVSLLLKGSRTEVQLPVLVSNQML